MDLAQVIRNKPEQLVLVIDNKWVQWLKDIKFDYKHKQVFIPYFKYEQFKQPEGKRYRSDNNGHLLLNNDGTVNIRYNYSLHREAIEIGSELNIVDIETFQATTYKVVGWTQRKVFQIQELYSLYKNQAWLPCETTHEKGYHYIQKQPKEFRNVEKQLRKLYKLDDYLEHINQYDYRDVRQIKDITYKNNFEEQYKIRRMAFESQLYCLLRQIDEIRFEEDFSLEQLGKQVDYIKYGKEPQLIFKSYWLDEENNKKQIQIRLQSWYRART